MDLTNEEINLAVAAIAGWTEIEPWYSSGSFPDILKGTNAAHPELGIFIPKYTESLDAISSVFKYLDLLWSLTQYKDFVSAWMVSLDSRFAGDIKELTPALALCKLLLAINPTPIAPPQVAIIDDDGDIEPPVFEAEFV